MAKTELRAWLTWLAITGAGAALAVLLPVNALIVLLYLFVGMVLWLCPAAFFYLLCAFGLSALMALFLPQRAWLRLGISIGLVIGGAYLVSTQLNAPIDRAFTQVVAQDVPLKLTPPYRRLVIIDDRARNQPRQGYQDDDLPCGPRQCMAYLHNAQVQAVLLPAAPRDRRPLTQRDYRVFTWRPGCPQAADPDDLRARIWAGECLNTHARAAVAVGDLIVHAFDVDIPGAVRDSDNTRVEVFVMLPGGPSLIKRETQFQIARYRDVPLPMRHAGWKGTNFDYGMGWKNGYRTHGRDYGAVAEDDLGLNPDIRVKTNR